MGPETRQIINPTKKRLQENQMKTRKENPERNCKEM
jgi:hypothetical protein